MAAIQIRMSFQKRLAFARRALAKTIDEMMAVALHMRQSDQIHQREILLQRRARVHGEIFGR